MNHYSEAASDIANRKVPRIRHVPPEINHAYLTGDIDHTTTINIPDVLPATVQITGKSGRLYRFTLGHVDYMTDEENAPKS